MPIFYEAVLALNASFHCMVYFHSIYEIGKYTYNIGLAYVTETGRLIGVVGLKELRDSITNADAIMEAK